jgi:hypothetical protein
VTILLSDLSGAGGLLKPVAFASARISSGASGDILTATAGVGQYLKLSYLLGAGSTEAGMTLTIDGVDLFTNSPLTNSLIDAQASISNFGVTSNYSSTSPIPSARLINEIYCLSFTLTKVTGTTGSAIDYAYETMEAL